ncbi:MAG: hypothetical protein H7Y31_07760 [Chitinophagaceae bacterium]|nr:hypothetical protein [Chitinophagaceae bacterium]
MKRRVNMLAKYKAAIVILFLFCVSCEKDDHYEPDGQTDKFEVRLKSVVWENLPSPFYHFVYSNDGFVTQFSFASGLKQYLISYDDGLIREVKNTVGPAKDKLVYEYAGDKVELIKYVNEAGEIFKRCFLDYNVNGQLISIEWEVKLAAGFQASRTLTFAYRDDGNLFEMKDHRFEIAGRHPELILIDRYLDYDSKVTADSRTLIHPVDDDMVLLPRVKLQKNNPRKVIRSGMGANYDVDYTYTYNAQNQPTLKAGDALFTSGPQAGTRFQFKVEFSYW